MVRKYDVEEVNRGRSFTYWLAVIVIVMAWIFAFKCYFSNYENQHPNIAWAAPGKNKVTASAEGIYLWDETVLYAPSAGKVYYPKGAGPVRVSTGQVVAKIINAAGAEKTIRAHQQGYFIAGTDGKEGNWRYSLLWTDLTNTLPKTKEIVMHADEDFVNEHEAVGKLIPQPQTLRFIGLIDSSSVLAQQISDNKLYLLEDLEDTTSSAEVSISVEEGGKTKFLLLLPWFKMSVISNRRGTILAETGRENGAVVPASAVVERDGVKGVYLIRGTRVIFHKVKGRQVSGNRYLVTEGINVGDAIVEDAKDTKEGSIQIW